MFLREFWFALRRLWCDRQWHFKRTAGSIWKFSSIKASSRTFFVTGFRLNKVALLSQMWFSLRHRRNSNLKTNNKEFKIFNLHQFETRLPKIITQAIFISSITFVFQFSSDFALFTWLYAQHRYYISQNLFHHNDVAQEFFFFTERW